MDYQIDQSGKTEDTKVKTVLAFSNKKKYTIIVLSKEKRKLVKSLRRRGYIGKTMYLQIFAAALFLLLRNDLLPQNYFTVDIEYFGREKDIKLYFHNILQRLKVKFPINNLTFRPIGKKSKAHVLALEVFRRKKRPDKMIGAEELMKVLLSNKRKKIGVR